MGTQTNFNKQRGIILLEGLIAILIFSMGILAVVGLQAAATRASTDARYRSEAAFFVNQVISEMWIADKSTLASNYGGLVTAGGPRYAAWLAQVQSSARSLPNAEADIAVTPVTNVVNVILRWKAPADPTPHQYVATAQVMDNL